MKTRDILLRSGLALLAAAALPAPHALAQQPRDAVRDIKAEAGLIAAEDARFQLLTTHDAARIARTMTPDAYYGHLTGAHNDRDKYVQDIESGVLPYKSLVAHDRIARAYGSVGITRGVVDMLVGERHLSDTYLAVYLRQGNDWVLLDWQSAAPPPKPGERPWLPGMPPPGFAPAPRDKAPGNQAPADAPPPAATH